MKKLAVWILILIFLTCYSYALECQYTTNESYAVEEILLYENESDDYIGPNLRFYDFNFDGASFKVYNTLRFDINIIVYYDFVYTFWGGQKERRSRELFIKKGSYEIVKDEWKCYTCTGFSILENSIDFVITNPGPIVPVKKMVTKTREVCKLCGDSICLDDGSPCNKSSECGGGFCVEGYCSNSEYCYEKDCKCSADEIQCSDNMHCVKKGIIPIDVTPECGKDSECVTGYIDKKTGLCARSPNQIQQGGFIILGIVIIFGLLTLILRHKLEIEKRKRVEKEIEKLRVEDEQVSKAKRELEKLENKKQQFRNEINQLLKDKESESIENKKLVNAKKIELDEINQEIDDKKQELDSTKEKVREIIFEITKNDGDYVKPHPSKTRAFWEWYNPDIKNAFYPCYVNQGPDGKYTLKTDKEIHKYLAETEIFNFHKEWFNEHYPNKRFSDLVVHHIDKDIKNYELDNLIIISKEEHRKILHSNIQHKNWESGIKELQRLNIESPHIPELGAELETDPYKILGVSRNATQEEITHAYKELIKINHPDKVNHLDPIFRSLAERRTKRIIAAYESLKRR